MLLHATKAGNIINQPQTAALLFPHLRGAKTQTLQQHCALMLVPSFRKVCEGEIHHRVCPSETDYRPKHLNGAFRSVLSVCYVGTLITKKSLLIDLHRQPT